MQFRLLSALLAVVTVLVSQAALACTVCGVGKEESRVAFILTTGILTVIPLAMIGFIIYYIYRQVKARERAIQENLSV